MVTYHLFKSMLLPQYSGDLPKVDFGASHDGTILFRTVSLENLVSYLATYHKEITDHRKITRGTSPLIRHEITLVNDEQEKYDVFTNRRECPLSSAEFLEVCYRIYPLMVGGCSPDQPAQPLPSWYKEFMLGETEGMNATLPPRK